MNRKQELWTTTAVLMGGLLLAAVIVFAPSAQKPMVQISDTTISQAETDTSTKSTSVAATMLTAGELLILLSQTVITILIFVWTRNQSSTYECDRLFLEIQKQMMSDPDLIKLWSCHDPSSSFHQLPIKDQKELAFWELHYFHMAFVYREKIAGRVDEEYWQMYQRWLAMLLKNCKAFATVHEGNKEFYERAFTTMVDKLAP